MRRKDKEVTDINEIYEVIDNCTCCRLGFCDNGEVYIVPLNFGYKRFDKRTVLYFHGAKEGRKISLINKVKKVGFEMDTAYKLKEGKTACSYSSSFQSIIGNGMISFVEDKLEKELALQSIMYHNTKKDDWQFNEAMINSVCVFKVEVTNMSCKAEA